MLNFREFNKDNLMEEIKKTNANDVEKAQDIINKYSSMSEEELNKKLAEAISKGKQDNTFDKQKIISQIDSLGTLLTPEQQQKMKSILDSFG